MAGTVLCCLRVLAPAGPKAPYGWIVPGIWRPFGLAMGVMAAAALTNLLATISIIGGTPLFASVSVIPQVISGTHFGRVWAIRIALLFSLAVVFLISRIKGREGRAALFLMLIILLLISVTESASGHPADKGDFTLRELNDWFHLLAAEAWGGGLLVLSAFIFPKVTKHPESGNHSTLLTGIAHRFSEIAGIAVIVMSITAVFNYLTYVGSAGALMGTPAGLAVLAKIILFLVILGIAAFNRYVSIPEMERWAGLPPRKLRIAGRMVRRLYSPFIRGRTGDEMARLFMRLVRVEMVLILALLFCAAILSHVSPASHYYVHMKQTGHGAR